MTSQALPKPLSSLFLMPRGEEGRRCERVASALTFVLRSSRTRCQAPWACLWALVPPGCLLSLLSLSCFTVLTDATLLLQRNRRKACLIKLKVKLCKHYRKHEDRQPGKSWSPASSVSCLHMAKMFCGPFPFSFLVYCPSTLWFIYYFLPFFCLVGMVPWSSFRGVMV